ncbi:calcineurin-like phosphoesterase C-terminal domain-containing protein [Desulfoglaeba alkanexedens]|uniref:Phosphohydrolase n=1 Tax=Desulfoglaeba alkanexedens ALDC TaxID=980445 RepID=A0A4P8L6N8_9BACT|nr:calcineurin-like phosphoesterase family protein [Desulfoglaeba alkanexedens]QCQ22775.1 phosphohydrolase [Desulfoglaeba alkanexedens ALDC]
MKRAGITGIAVSLAVMLTADVFAEDMVTGNVFWDKNQNGVQDRGEPGIEDVCVSNGKEVVKTTKNGIYRLPAYEDMVVFVSKPSGWMTPVNEDNIPQFSYIHKPAGSPSEIQRFRGLEPTGPLPANVDFPLYKVKDDQKFNVIVTGDTQVYNDREINYLRNSLVKEVQGTDALFCISMGDNLGDDLSLFPRYLDVMGQMGIPVYYVPGNHDLDFDATSDRDSFDTHKSYIGATYYSFNYGDVHFVVLDDVEYPSPIHNGSYNGKIDDTQMEWLANDLAHVPMDKLIVLNMHIPIVSDVDRTSSQHQVDNREELYALLKGRKVVSMAGHTHTLSHFAPGDELVGWGQPTPFNQIIVGAACGSWWSGDFDEAGIPISYMRDGTPRGYMVFSFQGNKYEEIYKAHGKPFDKQMNLSFLTLDFMGWYDRIASGDTSATINDLEFRDVLEDTASALLVANIWGASMHDNYYCSFDNRRPVEANWTLEMKDPYALALQLYVLRGVPGFSLWNKIWDNNIYMGTNFGPGNAVKLDEWLWTVEDRSTHLFVCQVPTDLEQGVHSVTVWGKDMYGHNIQEVKVFEVK